VSLADRTLFDQRLLAEGMNNGPANEIVNMRGKALWMFTHDRRLLIEKLCDNFWSYGRDNGWVWAGNAHFGGNNGNAGNSSVGVPLCQGACTGTNCGGFNGAVRQIAQRILGFGAHEFTNLGATCSDAFVTKPNVEVIDSSWIGNVRTMNSDFAAVKAFHFVNHSWNQFNGVHFDASTHVFNFQTKLQLYWCFLEGIGGIGGTFLVKAIFDTTIVIPGNPPYYCLSIPIMKQHLINFPVASGTEISVNFLNTLPSTSGAGGWSNYLLVSRDAIPNNFRAHYRYM
jgi:hypothetical protein